MKVDYSNQWFSVLREGKHYFIDEPGSRNGAAMFLVWGEFVVLVEQYRHAIGKAMIEIPRGYSDPGEESADCAIRETFEETGFKLSKDEIVFLGSVHPNSGILTSKINLYFSRTNQSRPGKNDLSEIDRCIFLPKKDFILRIADNTITDSFTISAFSMLCSKEDLRKIFYSD